MIDVDKMRSIAAELYALEIDRIYGASGRVALDRLLEAIHLAHRHVPYELMTGGMTVIRPLDNASDAMLAALGQPVEITPVDLPVRFSGVATLQLLDSGNFWFWPKLVDDFFALAASAVVYHYDKADYFILDGNRVEVPNASGFPSGFGIPTFLDLERALAFYATRLARCSTCLLLRPIWFDDKRLVLNNKPEQTMRESLAQFLRCTLRDYELIDVREEQNLGPSKPVDIKVSWAFSNRIAIIEVKWVGDSIRADRTRLGSNFRDQKARDGAIQLAGYLEDNRQYAATHPTMGYLVVFDARRRGLDRSSVVQTLSRADAFYYADRELQFTTRYEEIRRDFAPPVRMYLEPVDAP